MIHKTCSINYGHLADLQKYATDHNKKNFHLIKYLLATFIFFLSFQSVLVLAVAVEAVAAVAIAVAITVEVAAVAVTVTAVVVPLSLADNKQCKTVYMNANTTTGIS